MSPDQFVRRRQSDWEQLERLLQKAGRGALTPLSEAELRQLGQLYRATTADLALAQRDFPRHDVARFLNTLVGRAHHLVYRGARIERGSVRAWLRVGFPQLFRRNGRYILVAALLLFGPWILAQAIVAARPELGYVIAPGAAETMTFVEQTGELWIDIETAESSLAGAAITTNNIRVSFVAFAGGMTAGLLTIYVLILNGLQIGSLFGFVQAYGLAPGLWEFVTAHAPIELTVICIAGGAGLRVGHAMLVPGLLRRRDAVVQGARDAMGLAMGGALLLVAAGTIEGFISPSALPWAVKIAVALLSGGLMFAWLLLGGNDKAKGKGHP